MGSAVRSGVSYLTELIDRVARRFRQVAPVLAPVVLAVGCQSAEPTQPAVAGVAKVAAVVERPVVVDPGPRPLGKFSITFYYVIGEEEVVPRPAKKPAEPANDNAQLSEAEGDGAGGGGGGGGGAGGESGVGEGELAAVAPPDTVSLYGPKCERIAEVSRAFQMQLQLQGTGKLRDGRVVNIWGACKCDRSPCYKVTELKWGNGGNGRPLQPFRTVAVDPKLIKLGSLLYVPLLEGRTMPGRAPWGGFVHDGCVVADDTGGGIKDRQLDLFVGRKAWFLGLSGMRGSHSWAKHVPVYDGATVCQRKGRKVSRKLGAI